MLLLLFSGPLPESFRKLMNMRVLILSDNMLSGEIPDAFNSMFRLTHFSIHNNQLTGLHIFHFILVLLHDIIWYFCYDIIIWIDFYSLFGFPLSQVLFQSGSRILNIYKNCISTGIYLKVPPR